VRPEIEALLRQDGGLQAKTIWAQLNQGLRASCNFPGNANENGDVE
jgi:hypothetical protein